MAAAGETTEHGTPLPLRAVALLLASAAQRFIGVAIAFLWELPKSRESLTQDSRSAGKARLNRSVTRIIRRGALRSLQS